MARFVYIGTDDGPAKTSFKWRGSPKHNDLDQSGDYMFERGGEAVEVPDRLAERLRGNRYFAEEGTDVAKAAMLRRTAIEAAEQAATKARAKTQAELLGTTAPAAPPAEPAAAPAKAREVSDGGADAHRVAQQGVETPRSAGRGRKPRSE